jgi:hypothetical protein
LTSLQLRVLYEFIHDSNETEHFVSIEETDGSAGLISDKFYIFPKCRLLDSGIEQSEPQRQVSLDKDSLSRIGNVTDIEGSVSKSNHMGLLLNDERKEERREDITELDLENENHEENEGFGAAYTNEKSVTEENERQRPVPHRVGRRIKTSTMDQIRKREQTCQKTVSVKIFRSASVSHERDVVLESENEGKHCSSKKNDDKECIVPLRVEDEKPRHSSKRKKPKSKGETVLSERKSKLAPRIEFEENDSLEIGISGVADCVCPPKEGSGSRRPRRRVNNNNAVIINHSSQSADKARGCEANVSVESECMKDLEERVASKQSGSRRREHRRCDIHSGKSDGDWNEVEKERSDCEVMKRVGEKRVFEIAAAEHLDAQIEVREVRPSSRRGMSSDERRTENNIEKIKVTEETKKTRASSVTRERCHDFQHTERTSRKRVTDKWSFSVEKGKDDKIKNDSTICRHFSVEKVALIEDGKEFSEVVGKKRSSSHHHSHVRCHSVATERGHREGRLHRRHESDAGSERNMRSEEHVRLNVCKSITAIQEEGKMAPRSRNKRFAKDVCANNQESAMYVADKICNSGTESENVRPESDVISFLRLFRPKVDEGNESPASGLSPGGQRAVDEVRRHQNCSKGHKNVSGRSRSMRVGKYKHSDA